MYVKCTLGISRQNLFLCRCVEFSTVFWQRFRYPIGAASQDKPIRKRLAGPWRLVVSIMELETAIQYHSVGNAELTAGEFVDSTPVPRMSAAGAGCAEPGKRWGLVPAGGDGRRLLGLTQLVTGDDRPKQF